MALPHPQPWPDWVTQAWNIALGRRLRAGVDDWLAGPRGEIGGIGERVIAQVAAREGLVVERRSQVGLVESFAPFGELAAALHPRVAAFYAETASYDFDVWTKWELGWGPLARAVDTMFARRISQLCLPMDPLDTNRGVESEIIALRAPDGSIRHRIWLRKLRSRGTTIYSGFYSVVLAPSGECFIKVVFPLPKGSATVVMRATALAGGGLRLVSSGRGPADAGFYFIVEDRRGVVRAHYLKCFREFIDVYVDSDGSLRADHWMTLWGRRVYSLHYHIRRRAPHPVSAFLSA